MCVCVCVMCMCDVCVCDVCMCDVCLCQYLNIEVGSRGWPHGVNMTVTFNVVINEPPLLQEAMDTQNGPHVSSEVSTATGDRQILGRVQTKTINHKVAIRQVAGGERERVAMSEVIQMRAQNSSVLPRDLIRAHSLTFLASWNDFCR